MRSTLGKSAGDSGGVRSPASDARMGSHPLCVNGQPSAATLRAEHSERLNQVNPAPKLKKKVIPADFPERLLTLRLMLEDLKDALPSSAAALRKEMKAELDEMIRECRA